MFSKLGRFEIKDILGRGAMGEVYLGVDPILGREVAIKTILSSALPEDQARQRFDREAKAAAVLNSPNIVTIHELGEDQGVLFIAMERLRGKDLEQLLLERSLSLVEYLEALAQVCDGLDTAHRHHIIHRDIKPSNIMVMREGRKLLVKLMDFGVARLKDSAMTVVGTVMGTVNYIAPEYIKSGEPDARSDLFAVGVMLYECISGKKPFDGGTASTVLFKIVNDPPDPLDLSMLHGLSPALRNMTEKALAKNPDERFQSAEEFALALRAAKDPAWTGKVEETTLRMKIRPLEPPPVNKPDREQALTKAIPSRPGHASEVARKTPAPETEILKLPEPPPKPVPTPTEIVAAAKAGTAEFQVQPSEPPAGKTVILKLPEPPPKPLPPPTEIVAAAKAGTAEFQVQPSEPPAGKTVILKLPEPPPKPVPPPTEALAAAKAGTAEFQVQPSEPPAGKTVILKLPEPPPKPVPPPTEALAAAKAGTAEFQVQLSEPPAGKTVTLKPPELPAKPMAPSTAEVMVPMVAAAVFPGKPSEPLAGETEILKLPEPMPPHGAKVERTETSPIPVPVKLDLPQPRKIVSTASGSPHPAKTEVLSVTHASLPLPETRAEAPTSRPSPALLSAVSPATAPSGAGPVQEMPPVRLSKGPLVLTLGLILLVVLGGVGYFLYARSRAVPPPSVAPVSPTPSSPEPVPPASLPVPEAAELAPVVQPSAAPAKPAKAKVKVVKTPAPVPKAPIPAPAPIVEIPVAPAPAAATPPPAAPVQEAKAKWKVRAEEATKKRLEREEHSRK